MRKIYIIILAVLLVSGAQAQFTDNFDSYTAGEGISTKDNWRTWENNAADVQVVNDRASSGSNSIYFESNAATGGPADIILEFNSSASIISGLFDFSFKINVEADRAGYFNLQATPNDGAGTVLSVYFTDDNEIIVWNSEGLTIYEGSYTSDTWVEVNLDVDLTSNIWKLNIDEELVVEFSNGDNRLASCNLYPVNPADQGSNDLTSFWIDDVAFNVVEQTLPALDGAVTGIEGDFTIVGQKVVPTVVVRNVGEFEIDYFEVEVRYDNRIITQQIENVSIESLEYYEVELDKFFRAAQGAELEVTLNFVNGVAEDDNVSNNTFVRTTSDLIVPGANKFVVAEEATGTWCQFCPRGHVFMDRLADEYPEFIQGIAVHNRDPMVISNYDSWLAQRIGGYPSGLVDRGAETGPVGFETAMLDRIGLDGIATVDLGFTIDGTNLTVNADVTTTTTVNGDMSLVLVVIEDNVNRDENGYAQVNAYSGGGLGEMGGYENLPNPVPAADMIYNDVARLINSPDGELLGSNIAAGTTFNVSETFILESDWNTDEMSVVAMIIDNNDLVSTGGVLDFVPKVDEREEAETDVSSINRPEVVSTNLNVYPNPATDVTYINVQLNKATDVKISVKNLMGAAVLSKDYGMQVGDLTFPIVTSELNPGMYIVEFYEGNNLSTGKIVVE